MFSASNSAFPPSPTCQPSSPASANSAKAPNARLIASKATSESHAKNDETRLPLCPYCARDTISVEVPAFGPGVAAMPIST
jgi:hypothetical protein